MIVIFKIKSFYYNYEEILFLDCWLYNYFNFLKKLVVLNHNYNYMKLSIIIPCYNEVKTINKILEKIILVCPYEYEIIVLTSLKQGIIILNFM